MVSGVYQIKNRINGKCYIGSSVNLRHRQREHVRKLQRGKHRNRHLQRAFDKYGIETFVFSILEYVSSKKLIESEQHYLDVLKPEYNICLIAGSTLGSRHTAETCARLSQSHMGKRHSAKTRRKMSIAQSGERHPNYDKQASAETRAKMSEAHKGNYHSDEARQRISEAKKGERHPMYGKHLNVEHRRKISIAQKARWRRIHAAKVDAGTA